MENSKYINLNDEYTSSKESLPQSDKEIKNILGKEHMIQFAETTGYVNIILHGIKISADFIGGKLYRGKITYGNITYNGIFDSEGLLSGPNCEIITDEYIYRGNFSSGIMISGKKLDLNDRILEAGEYTYMPPDKTPQLIRGEKLYGEYILNGVFDKYGNLIEGKMYNTENQYRGVFESNKLIDGTVVYKVNDKSFFAKYTMKYDNLLCKYVFKNCFVDWNGKLNDLPMKLIIMVCCNGYYSTVAHKFIINHLSDFDGTSYLYLNKNMFNSLNEEERIGLFIIIDNIKKYSDYKGICEEKIKRVHSTGNLKL